MISVTLWKYGMVIKIDNVELFDGHPFQDNKRFTLKQHSDGDLIKSKNRVQKHGEVFTPKWIVKKMLATPEIQDKIHDLHATFLESSAGEGAFLTEVLHQKLNYVDDTSKKKEWQVNALWALMSIYGIEYLEDNLFKARQAMTDVLINHYQNFFPKELSGKTEFFRSANLVIKLNVVQVDTLKYKQRSCNPIIFNEWKMVNNDEVLRVPFTYESLFEDDEDNQLDIFSSNDQINLFDEFANNLSTVTARGNGTAEQREENIRRLLNFFPVIGEDENGKMVELDPKQVLSIPRRLKSQEVVNHGFMNNFLFANISNIFNAPDEVKEILNGFVIAREDKSKKRDTIVNDANDVNVD